MSTSKIWDLQGHDTRQTISTMSSIYDLFINVSLKSCSIQSYGTSYGNPDRGSSPALKMDILAGSYEASIPSTKGQCLIYLLHSKQDDWARKEINIV